MTFLIVFIALLTERFFHWTHLRHWRWLEHYQAFLARWIEKWANKPLSLVCSLLPLVLLVEFISVLLIGRLYGLLSLIFGVLVLLYCLGPSNLWMQVTQSLEALAKGETANTTAELSASFHLPSTIAPSTFHQALTRAIFVAANQRIFAVVFWFIVLGPMGAILYRLISLYAVEPKWGLSQIASRWVLYLDWIPARLLAVTFALGGHFTDVMACLKKHWKQPAEQNDILLADCGMAALDSTRVTQSGMEKEALALLDRVVVIVLVLLALMVFVV